MAGTRKEEWPLRSTLDADATTTRPSARATDEAGVAVVQGEAYGFSPYFRASFVASDADIKRGGERIAKACAALV